MGCQDIFALAEEDAFLADNKASYDWLMAQMKERLPDYQGNIPWQANIDLLQPEFYQNGYVYFVLEIPEDQAVRVWEGGWMCCMSNDFSALSQAEYNAYRQRLRAAGGETGKRPDQFDEEIQQSWLNMFNLDTPPDAEWCGVSQLLFFELRPEYVRRAFLVQTIPLPEKSPV